MSVTYRPASEVRRIAEWLIPQHHPDLDQVRIEYVFRSEAAKSRGKQIWGKARKVTGLNAYLATLTGFAGALAEMAELDATVSINGTTLPSDTAKAEPFFVLEIAEDVWAQLDGSQRTALVDHELCHFAVGHDDDGQPVLSTRPHDLEEFRSIVERHGLWRPDVELMARSFEQLDMRLDVQPAAATARVVDPKTGEIILERTDEAES